MMWLKYNLIFSIQKNLNPCHLKKNTKKVPIPDLQVLQD